MNVTKNLVMIMLGIGLSATAQTPKPKVKTATQSSMINKEFKDAVQQYKLLASNLKPDRFPKAFFPKNDSLATSTSEWWCSGFYPGTLLYLYDEDGLLLTYKK